MGKPIKSKSKRGRGGPDQGQTGPRTPEGKARVRTNALKHGLRATPEVARGSWSAEVRAQLERAVGEIAKAEGLDNELDRSLIRDFLTLDLMAQRGTAWLLEHGVITATVWKSAGADEDGNPILLTDTENKLVRDAAVPVRAIQGLEVLLRHKAKLHERLRAKKDAQAGAPQGTIVVGMWQPKPRPPPKEGEAS